MKRTLRYAAAYGGVVIVASVGAALVLDPPGLAGVLAAAAVALPVQIAAFAVLTWAQVDSNRFLAAWVGGTLVRLVVVGVAGWVLVALLRLPPLPILLGLAGFSS